MYFHNHRIFTFDEMFKFLIINCIYLIDLFLIYINNIIIIDDDKKSYKFNLLS